MNEQAYPWLGTQRHGVLIARHNPEETPMQQETGSSVGRPDRSLPLLPLDEMVRRGAQRVLQTALDVEVELFLERYQYLMNGQGHRRVVRNGHRPVRRILTGAGPVAIATPRVDDRVLA